MTAGVYTFTFPTAYTSTPVCTATEEGSTGSVAHGVPSTTSYVVTSTVTTGNTDVVDITCIGDPN